MGKGFLVHSCVQYDDTGGDMPERSTPAERSLRASLAAQESWARTEDRRARTAAASQAFKDKFLEQAGGDPVKAEHLRKAFYLRLSLKAATAKRKAREAREAVKEADRLAREAEAAEKAALADADPGDAA